MAKTLFVLAVDPSSPYNSVKDLTEALKKKGDKAAYAYVSPTANVASVMYKQRTGIQALGVPFNANVQTLSEMRSSQIDFQFLDGTSAMGLISAGRLRALAVTTPRRSALMPDTPTMAESGVPEFDVSPWWGVFLPANVPQPVVDKLESWFNQFVAMEDTRIFLTKLPSPWLGLHTGCVRSICRIRTARARWLGICRPPRRAHARNRRIAAAPESDAPTGGTDAPATRAPTAECRFYRSL